MLYTAYAFLPESVLADVIFFMPTFKKSYILCQARNLEFSVLGYMYESSSRSLLLSSKYDIHDRKPIPKRRFCEITRRMHPRLLAQLLLSNIFHAM